MKYILITTSVLNLWFYESNVHVLLSVCEQMDKFLLLWFTCFAASVETVALKKV